MSFKPMVQTDSTGKWYGNALAFATEAEALANAQDLMFRWFAVRECCAMPSDEPVSHTYVNGILRDAWPFRAPLAREVSQ